MKALTLLAMLLASGSACAEESGGFDGIANATIGAINDGLANIGSPPDSGAGDND